MGGEKPTTTKTADSFSLMAPPPAEKITKVEMVRRAIAAGHSQPLAGIQYIKDTFNTVMKTTAFSSNKFGLERKGKVNTGSGRRTVHTAAAPALRIQPAPANGAVQSPAMLIRQLRALVAIYGAEAVAEVLTALSE